MKTLSVQIDKEGKVTILPTGFGSSCSEVVDLFKSLGDVEHEEDTEEMYESQEKEKEHERI